MWHQNLEAEELAGSSVGPIVGGVIAVGFSSFGHVHYHDHISQSMVMILSGNRPGGKSCGGGFPLDEEEKVSGSDLHEQGTRLILLNVQLLMQCF